MAPLHWFALAYALGILLESALPLPIWAVALACILAAGAAVWLAEREGASSRAPSVLLLAAALLAGCASYGAATSPGGWDPSRLPSGTRVAVLGRMLRDIPPDAERATVALRAQAVRVGETSLPLRGDVVIRARGAPEVNAGDAAVVVGRIEHLRGARRPGDFDAARYYARRFGAFSQVVSSGLAPVEGALPASVGDLRAWLIGRTRELCSDPERPERGEVMLSMVFGAPSSALTESTLDLFRRAGTIHVLVVSGAQISLMAGIAFWLSRWRRLPGWAEGLLALLLAGGYALLLPPDGSIVRALALVVVLVIGRSLHRDTEPLSALGTALFLVLCCQPTMLFSLSLQLSALAVGGAIIAVRLALGSGTEESRQPSGLRTLLTLLFGGLGAWLATAPLIAHVFGSVSLIAPLANLLVVPPAGALTVLMFLSVPLGLVAPPLARGLNCLGGVLAEAVLSCSELAGELRWSSLEGIEIPAWGAILAYALLGALAWGLLRRRRRAAPEAFVEAGRMSGT